MQPLVGAAPLSPCVPGAGPSQPSPTENGGVQQSGFGVAPIHAATCRDVLPGALGGLDPIAGTCTSMSWP